MGAKNPDAGVDDLRAKIGQDNAALRQVIADFTKKQSVVECCQAEMGVENRGAKAHLTKMCARTAQVLPE